MKKSPTTLHFDLLPKKPQSEVVITRSAYNTAVPINIRTGFYAFSSSSNGPICLFVSCLARDWPVFQLKSQAGQYAETWVAFARLWLADHGWSPVTVRYLPDGYTSACGFEFNDPQKRLRDLITADFLAEENRGRPMHEWRGLKGAPQYRSILADVIGAKS